MYTESMQIAELFRDPRKIQRAGPLNRVIANTYGKGKPGQAAPPPEGADPGPPKPPPGYSAPRPDDYWGFY